MPGGVADRLRSKARRARRGRRRRRRRQPAPADHRPRHAQTHRGGPRLDALGLRGQRGGDRLRRAARRVRQGRDAQPPQRHRALRRGGDGRGRVHPRHPRHGPWRKAHRGDGRLLHGAPRGARRACGVSAAAPHPHGRRRRRARLRQPHGRPHRGGGGLLRRALRGQPAGLLRLCGAHAPLDGPQGGAAGGPDRRPRRTHGTRRRARRHLLLGAARERPCGGVLPRCADRQPHRGAQGARRPAPRPRRQGRAALHRRHRLRRRRLLQRYRRDGGEDRRGGRPGQGAAQVRRPQPRGDLDQRGPGAHGPGGSARQARGAPAHLRRRVGRAGCAWDLRHGQR